MAAVVVGALIQERFTSRWQVRFILKDIVIVIVATGHVGRYPADIFTSAHADALGVFGLLVQEAVPLLARRVQTLAIQNVVHVSHFNLALTIG